MRRWNGWGGSTVDYPLPDGAGSFLRTALGDGSTSPDASIESVIDRLPASRLDNGNGLSIDSIDRLLHTHGQSLPDWIALRSGDIGRPPDGVAYPETAEHVRDLLRLAQQKGLRLIPYGGGTSVVGHINPLENDQPVITLDLRHMNSMLDLDESSRLARFQAGITGPAIERNLSEHGYTLGHFPQSWEYSTLGGWIATRSTGQQSYYYGRIEDLYVGGSLETPTGTLLTPPFPASAAGPDLRELVLGSEGRLGVITEASVRVQPSPGREAFFGIFFRDWESGAQATQALAQAQAPVSMIRLSDSQETITTLALAGKPRLIQAADGLLRILGAGEGRCMMIVGITGSHQVFNQQRGDVMEVVRSYGGLPTGTLIGKQWKKSRFRSPYLRNTLWEYGYALDTLETAVPWSQVQETRIAILEALHGAFTRENKALLQFSHLSHVYTDGASIYITYLYPRQDDPGETLSLWKTAKQAASEAIVAHQGTISHQHGVGLDHLPFLQAEKGMVGLRMLQSVSEALDPQRIMNPGKGWPDV
jgi:alkyldihydroxyacetonephosphate synthase